jgi:mono/diheme cytochrome c family protein
MQAIVAYIKFLSTGVAPGEVLSGLGVGRMPELDRAADPARGKTIYATACLACHNTDGSGIRRSLPTTDLGYMIPPLWGSDSFNDGAGMARLITAANFIHFNMPHGADYLHPQLTVEQAWDVAAYMISQPRPRKAGLDKDFPTCWRSRSIRPTALMPTASTSSSTNTARSRRSARRSRGSRRRRKDRRRRRAEPDPATVTLQSGWWTLAIRRALKHNPEKLQTFRIRSCDRTNTWSEIAIQSERISL